MLMEKAVSDSSVVCAPPSSPSSASVTYDTRNPDERLIQVPVFIVDLNQVVAPPFLIPGQKWTVIYTLQDSGKVFYDVKYTGPDALKVITNNTNPPGQSTWKTEFDTNNVTFVNKLDCTIFLDPPFTKSFDRESSGRIHGDPTIAVVPDPMG